MWAIGRRRHAPAGARAQLRGDLLAQLLHGAVAAGDPAALAGPRVFAKIRRGGRALWLSGVCWSVMFTAFMVALTLTSVANVLVTMALGPLAHGAGRADLHRPPPAGAHLGRHRGGGRWASAGCTARSSARRPAGWARWSRCACRSPARVQLDGGPACACQGPRRRPGARRADRRRDLLAGHAAAGLAVPGQRARPRPAGACWACSSWRFPACCRCCARAC